MSAYTYTIDQAHSTIRFWVRHLMISKVHGEFPDVTGTVVGSSDSPELAQIDVTVGVASVNTGQEQRDGHLKSADFFDVENFPNMTFKSKSIKSTGEGEFDVVGDLTLHGVTKEITLKAEVSPEVVSPFGGFKVGVSATGVVNREDFGMGWNQLIEAGGVAVGKDIHFTIDLELDRPA